MEIEKIASAVASAQNIAGAVQSSGAQNPQIDELQRLADSIRKIENDCRVTARVQGLSEASLQMKLRQYDDLLSKINDQIRDLQHANQSAGRSGVSMLQLNTDATQVNLRTSGKSISMAVSEHLQRSPAQAQVSEAELRTSEQAAALKAAQQAMAEKAAARHGGDRAAPPGSINVLI